MDNNKSTPGHKDWELTHKEVAYQGFFRIERLWLRHKTFAGGWTDTFSRELFERGEVVCVLLYDPQRDVLVFTEQFRVGAIGADNTPWLTELVAGMVEAGESVEDVAARETMEEAGCRFERLLPICSYWSSPGGTSERVHLFCGLLD
ncbi:NUDIX domain-containing protein, partial [Gilvimarinus sp. 1_MG-2023]